MILSGLLKSVSIIAGDWRCGSCKISCWVIRTNFRDSKIYFKLFKMEEQVENKVNLVQSKCFTCGGDVTCIL